MEQFSALNLTREQLLNNFAYWKKQLSDDPLYLPDPNFLNSPVTHSFPALKKWSDATPDTRLVYEEVLFSHKALLSDASRETAGLFQADEPRRVMAAARACDLHHFVFGYLGVHDPYYAGTVDVPVPLFGVFFKPEIESFPDVNATRRDLASPETSGAVELQFLLPEHARILGQAECSTTTRHRGDFWHYWGAPKYWDSEPTLRRHAWEWKYEFHYRDQVPIKQMGAVLWPLYYDSSIEGGMILSEVSERAAKFIHDCPGVAVIHYDWGAMQPARSFEAASFLVTYHFLTHGEFPKTLEDARATYGTL